jgi:hypothetical protein
MSTGLHAANIVDLASYRAHRNQAAAAVRMNSGFRGSVVFNVVPVMIPVVAWIPIWPLTPSARSADATNE